MGLTNEINTHQVYSSLIMLNELIDKNIEDRTRTQQLVKHLFSVYKIAMDEFQKEKGKREFYDLNECFYTDLRHLKFEGLIEEYPNLESMVISEQIKNYLLKKFYQK